MTVKQHNYALYKTCAFCNTEHVMHVNLDDFLDWQGGKYIQNAMPYLDESQRELLISGVCGTCFDKLFGGEDE